MITHVVIVATFCHHVAIYFRLEATYSPFEHPVHFHLDFAVSHPQAGFRAGPAQQPPRVQPRARRLNSLHVVTAAEIYSYLPRAATAEGCVHL